MRSTNRTACASTATWTSAPAAARRSNSRESRTEAGLADARWRQRQRGGLPRRAVAPRDRLPGRTSAHGEPAGLAGPAGAGRCARCPGSGLACRCALSPGHAALLLPPAGAGGSHPLRGDDPVSGRAAAGRRQAALPAGHAQGPLCAADPADPAQAPHRPGRAGAHPPARPRDRRPDPVLGAAGHARRLPAPVPRAGGGEGLRGDRAIQARPGPAHALPQPPAGAQRGLHADGRGGRHAECGNRHRPAGTPGRAGPLRAAPHDRPEAPTARPDERPGPAHRRRPHLSVAATRADTARLPPAAAAAGTRDRVCRSAGWPAAALRQHPPARRPGRTLNHTWTNARLSTATPPGRGAPSTDKARPGPYDQVRAQDNVCVLARRLRCSGCSQDSSHHSVPLLFPKSS
eukprot:Opistho-2@57717